jgi:hypothetical protein
MHRFVWDLRYGRTGETTPEDDDEAGEHWSGPLVMPGAYRIKLLTNGRELVQPLQVAMDPRAHVTQAVLLTQFQWAQRAFEGMISARKATAELRSLQLQLGKYAAPATSASAPLASSIANASRTASGILSGPGKGTGAKEAAKESDDGLVALTRSLTVVLNAIESADRTPPSQVIQAYRESEKNLDARLAEWKSLKQRTLPALNEELRHAGLQPVQITELEEYAEQSLAQ